jgi:hypothetical protein
MYLKNYFLKYSIYIMDNLEMEMIKNNIIDDYKKGSSVRQIVKKYGLITESQFNGKIRPMKKYKVEETFNIKFSNIQHNKD